MVRQVMWLSALLLLLTGCSSPKQAGPAAAVSRYLQAKVSGDAATIRKLLCHTMEADFERELHSFDGVEDAELVGMVCDQVGRTDLVRCQGSIQASYGSEQTEFALTTYWVVWEGQEWKWCGQADGSAP